MQTTDDQLDDSEWRDLRETKRSTRVRRWLVAGIPVLLVGAAFALQAPAFAAWGRHGLSPERMERMIDKRVDHVLDDVDATADQKARIKAALARAKPELKALLDERVRLRQAAHTALAAERVDPGEVERLRAETVKLAERGSALLSRTLTEVAQVLQPAQRRELLEHWKHRGGH